MEDADCDMLAIFDSCFASNLHKHVPHEENRIYELLAASGHDRTTAGPGPNSFTNALISSLRALLEQNRPFTTRELCERINLQPKRRKNQSHVWSRFKQFDRYITLAPLAGTLDERKRQFHYEPTRAMLSLRLPLTADRLTELEIATLARTLARAIREQKIPVKRIDWWRLRSSGRTREFADLGRFVQLVRAWKRKALDGREARSRQGQQRQPPPPIAMETVEQSMPTVEGMGMGMGLSWGSDAGASSSDSHPNPSTLQNGQEQWQQQQQRPDVHSDLLPINEDALFVI